MIAHALGGRANKMPDYSEPSEDKLPLFVGKEDIRLREEFVSKPYARILQQLQLQNLVAQVSHGDHVESLPPDAENLAYSNTTP